MCKRQTTSGATGLILDAFLSETTSTTCDCHLQATQPMKIGVSAVLFPERDCGSTLTIHTPRTLMYTCVDGDQSEVHEYNPRKLPDSDPNEKCIQNCYLLPVYLQ